LVFLGGQGGQRQTRGGAGAGQGGPPKGFKIMLMP